MATYNFSNPVTYNHAGAGGQYGYVNGFPVLNASIADSVLAANNGFVSGDAAGRADNAMGWDTGSVQGTLANGAGVFGVRYNPPNTDSENPSPASYSGDMDAAARALNLNVTGLSDAQKYDAINNAARDLYLVSGKTGYQAGGVGGDNGESPAIPGATTNHATVLYRKEGDALVPLADTAQYFNGEMELSPGSGLSDFISAAAPIAGIALMATGAGAALGGALLSGAGVAGASAATTGALGGAVIGGGISAATGGNVLTGAALGGLGGYAQGGGFNGIGSTLSNTFSEITGLDTSTISNAFTSANDVANQQFAAADALNLAQNGVGTAAIQQNLIASGVDSLTAATLAQNAVMPGATLASLTESIAGAPTYSNLGTSGASTGSGTSQTATNAATNNLTNTAIRATAGSLLGGVAAGLPSTIAGFYGANQEANRLADYATALQQNADRYGTTLTTNIGNIASGLPSAARAASGMITGAAGAGAGSITSAANQAGAALTGVANQQAGQTTALAGQLAPSLQFTPVGMTTRFGSTTTPQYDSEGRLTGFGYTVANDIAAQRDRLLGLSNQALPETTDIGQATTNYYNELQALQNPQREQQLAALRAQLQTTGRGGLAFGATTGASGNALAATNPELAAYYNALAQQQSQQALTAQDVAQQRLNQQLALSSGLFGQAQTLEGAGQQALTLGTNLGSLATQGATNAANLQMNAQQVAAAQQISAQLQASGWDVQAANNAATLQVQAATNAAQMQNAAAINQANLNAEAQRQAALMSYGAGQTGAGLLTQGTLAQNAAIQQGIAGVAPAVGNILQPIGNAVGNSIGNAVGGLLGGLF